MKRTVKELLQHVASGKSNAEIGALYGVGQAAIDKDLGVIYASLDLTASTPNCKRAEAIAVGFRRGFLN